MNIQSAPTIFIIMGITGDLAQKKILPSLYDLFVQKKLPEKLAIIGFSRRNFSKNDIDDFISKTLSKVEETKLKSFLAIFSYVQGNFNEIDSYTKLAGSLYKIDTKWGMCSNKLFYLSVPPAYYEEILAHMFESGLSLACGGDLGWTRVLIEKPFGDSEESAMKLEKVVESKFKEEQIYRIDHYLAKTSLTHILEFRKKPKYKKNWNKQNIEKIEIKLIEKNIVEARGDFYDKLGTVYDVGQNHVLQMVALAAMELNEIHNSETFRKNRLDLFKHISVSNVNASRGQYIGYQGHSGVMPNSQTETFFACKLLVQDYSDISGVPIFISAGKGFNIAETSIKIIFKNGEVLGFISPASESVEAYEKVLLDCIAGDQSVFTSTEEVIEEWKIAEKMKKTILTKALTFYNIGSENF